MSKIFVMLVGKGVVTALCGEVFIFGREKRLHNQKLIVYKQVGIHYTTNMLLTCPLRTISKNVITAKCLSHQKNRRVVYIQGQESEHKIREYFYYIDHQGMLFLDDSKMKNFTSCFKEKKFLDFFFKRIRLNTTGRYENEFPFISLCGRERNFIRCDDLPIVYTNVVNLNNNDLLCYGYAGDLLTVQFMPDKIYMLPSTGRVYHPAEDKYGGVGLIKSKLAIELSKYFEFNSNEMQSPSHFTWKNKKYELDQNWFQAQVSKFQLQIKSDI